MAELCTLISEYETPCAYPKTGSLLEHIRPIHKHIMNTKYPKPAHEILHEQWLILGEKWTDAAMAQFAWVTPKDAIEQSPTDTTIIPMALEADVESTQSSAKSSNTDDEICCNSYPDCAHAYPKPKIQRR